jgi:nitroreductase
MNSIGVQKGGEIMNIDELLTLMRERRSIRAYKPDPVPEEYIEKILEAGRWAPSSANSQPWDFIVIQDRKVKEKVHSVILDAIEKIKTLRDFPFLKTFTAAYVLDAPINIVVCGDPRFIHVALTHGIDSQIEQFSFLGSASLAIQNMILATHCLGLGSDVFTSIFPDKIKKVLGIPDPLRVICILPIGFPAEKPDVRYRRETSEFTHQDLYDLKKMRPDEFVEEARKDPSKLFLKRA